VDNNIPNLTASTVGGPVFGSLQHAMVRRIVRGAEVMRLTERYADFLAEGLLGLRPAGHAEQRHARCRDRGACGDLT
jgi:hypothetical protein